MPICGPQPTWLPAFAASFYVIGFFSVDALSLHITSRLSSTPASESSCGTSAIEVAGHEQIFHPQVVPLVHLLDGCAHHSCRRGTNLAAQLISQSFHVHRPCRCRICRILRSPLRTRLRIGFLHLQSIPFPHWKSSRQSKRRAWLSAPRDDFLYLNSE